MFDSRVHGQIKSYPLRTDGKSGDARLPTNHA